MGTARPDAILYNRGAQAGDVLVLTKPLGTGLWGTALKRELYCDSHPQARAAIEMMARLNKDAAEALTELELELEATTGSKLAEYVHACTDITGFGLAGHMHEMLDASGLAAAIRLDALPLLDGAWELSRADVRPGKTKELVAWAKEFMSFDEGISAEDVVIWQGIVCDPQTSGGLLLSMSEEAALRYKELYPQGCLIGTVEKKDPGTITFY
jgi:selenide,water dikinase